MMLILPVLTLTLIELGYVLRITRASMVEVMKSPYIRTAFLKGLPFRQVVLKHAVRNALIAPITVIMLHVNWLLGGIVIVEVVFGWPGMGRVAIEAIWARDYPVIMATTFLAATLVVCGSLLADLLYQLADPRVRLDRRSAS